jgi:hypothetical protein
MESGKVVRSLGGRKIRFGISARASELGAIRAKPPISMCPSTRGHHIGFTPLSIKRISIMFAAAWPAAPPAAPAMPPTMRCGTKLCPSRRYWRIQRSEFLLFDRRVRCCNFRHRFGNLFWPLTESVQWTMLKAATQLQFTARIDEKC